MPDVTCPDCGARMTSSGGNSPGDYAVLFACGAQTGAPQSNVRPCPKEPAEKTEGRRQAALTALRLEEASLEARLQMVRRQISELDKS